MARTPNTDKSGRSFTPQTVQAVWERGTIDPNYNANDYRRDRCRMLIRRDKHGDMTSTQGWHVDHDQPVEKGGGDELANLQPLQWENNLHKSDNWPNWSCKRSA